MTRPPLRSWLFWMPPALAGVGLSALVGGCTGAFVFSGPAGAEGRGAMPLHVPWLANLFTGTALGGLLLTVAAGLVVLIRLVIFVLCRPRTEAA